MMEDRVIDNKHSNYRPVEYIAKSTPDVNENNESKSNIMSTSYRPFPPAIKESTRIRISEEQRQNLVTSYNQQLEEGDLLNHKLGMNNSTFLELVKGRDSVSIPFMLKIQNALGIEIVSKDRLTQSCREYINFIFHKTHSSNNESINP